MKDFSDYRFLIIGGASKAGTTSMFSYLAGHPQICASEAKETRFFLDSDYPLSSPSRCEKNGKNAYLSFFNCDESRRAEDWRLEATPDYLYSRGTPGLISATLPRVHFIFVLREPISRLLSFYRFGQQLNEIPMAMTFDQYIEVQKNNPGENCPNGYNHPSLCALQHGRYSIYLKRFLELFDRSALHIAFYEELRRDPLAFMSSICRWADIDENYYQHYVFDIKNRSVRMRSPRLHRAYFDAREKARLLIRHRPRVRSLFRGVGRRVNAWYRRMNVTKREEIAMSDSTRNFIAGYYEEEPARLKQLVGVDVPWPKYDSCNGVSPTPSRACR